MFVCASVCSSDEEKSAPSEKYSVVECGDSERTGLNSSAAACCPKTGSDSTYTHHLPELISAHVNICFSSIICLTLLFFSHDYSCSKMFLHVHAANSRPKPVVPASGITVDLSVSLLLVRSQTVENMDVVSVTSLTGF